MQDNAFKEILRILDEFKKDKKTGNIELKFNFFKGSLGTYKIAQEQTYK